MFDNTDHLYTDVWSYFSDCPILFEDLFSGVLEGFGVREHITEQTTENVRCLSDGAALLWAVQGDAGRLDRLQPDTRVTKPEWGITMAVEKAFWTDLTKGGEAERSAMEGETLEAYFVKRAQAYCDQLRADLLGHVWRCGRYVEPGLRRDLAEAVRKRVVSGRAAFPRSLDAVAQVACEVLSGGLCGQLQASWASSLEARPVPTQWWVDLEIARDEFQAAWLKEDGVARRALNGWVRAILERRQRVIPIDKLVFEGADWRSPGGSVARKDSPDAADGVVSEQTR